MTFDEARCEYFFASAHPFAEAAVRDCRYPWEIVARLDRVFDSPKPLAACGRLRRITDNIWLEEGAYLEDGATVEGRLIAGRGSVIRRGAVLRGDVILGRGCLVGHFTEVKNALLYDGVQLPHFSYVGDSVLGRCAHLGAGAKVSNFKSFGTSVRLHFDDRDCDLHTEKFGAVLGDGVEVGCNAVLNPGSVLGPYSVVYPLVSFRGTVAGRTIVKSGDRGDDSPRRGTIG